MVTTGTHLWHSHLCHCSSNVSEEAFHKPILIQSGGGRRVKKCFHSLRLTALLSVEGKNQPKSEKDRENGAKSPEVPKMS
jgi:hypothetical protein